MLTKAVVFLFCVMAVFGLLYSGIATTTPASDGSSFITYQTSFATYENKTIATYFDAQNYTMYSSQAGDNMTYPYQNLDIPTGLGANEVIELYWGSGYYSETVPIWLNHATKQSFLGYTYRTSHHIQIHARTGMKLEYDLIHLADLEDSWNGEDSFFTGQCEHLTINLIVLPSYGNETIEEGWNNGRLSYLMSYGINQNGTAQSIWTLLGQLFSFKPINLGMGGFGEVVIGGAVGAFMWALVIIIAYKITMGIIPWVSGGSGD